jgi:hypothetical protein
MLVSLAVAWMFGARLAQYRELRYGTETTSGLVISVTKTRHSWERGSYIEAQASYAFKTPDGRTHRGTIVYRAAGMEHLKPGAAVEVHYRRDDPDRNTTADGLFMLLWWGLVPQGALLAVLLVLTATCMVASLRRWRQGDSGRDGAAGPGLGSSIHRSARTGIL